MKKYQQLVKNNYDDFIQAEDNLLHEFHNNDDFKISDVYLRNLYEVSGALQVIDEHYNFDRLPLNIAVSFANLLITYATCMPESHMSHQFQMHCFELAREVKNNVHWHRIRQPLPNR